MRYLPGLLTLLVAFCGCGNGNFGSTSSNAADGTNEAAYHAYGDSITAGYGLPVPSQSYPYLFAAANKLSLANYGESAAQSCDIASRQIFPHADSPSSAAPKLFTLIIGTNEVDRLGTSLEGTSNFNLCQQAVLAWLGVPVENKTLATAASVTHTGATHLEAVWNALTTDAAGASISLPLTTTRTAPIYVWYRVTDANSGTASYTLDGNNGGVIASTSAYQLLTSSGTRGSLALLRIPSVPPGNHTLKFIQTSSDASGFGVVAIASPPAAGSGGSRILLGTIPLQLVSAAFPCSTSQAPCDVYNKMSAANIGLFSGDGLNIQTFDSRKYMTGTAADMLDQVHPNAFGHTEIKHGLQDAY